MSSKAEADGILNDILSSHKVDAAQVKALEGFVNADWVVDHEETELLFKANQALGENDEHCPEWSDFFVSSVARVVVMDMETPGEIDEQEGNWLGGLFEQYGTGNNSESRLCAEIKKTTSKIEGKAAEKLQ